MKKINFSVLFSHLLLAVLVTVIFYRVKKDRITGKLPCSNCTDGVILHIQTCAFSFEKRIGVRDYILTVDSVLDLGNRSYQAERLPSGFGSCT